MWTGERIALGVLSTLFAVALAAIALRGPGLPGSAVHRPRDLAAAGTRRLIVPLRRPHSGRLGDNAAWLATGVTLLLAAFTTLT